VSHARSNDTLERSADFTLDPNNKEAFSGSPYPYGFDPVWALSLNKITFTNSFKEKISVIFGITQMMAGVILSLFNHL
jgi:V-type H+-transporting ATPase subunit a